MSNRIRGKRMIIIGAIVIIGAILTTLLLHFFGDSGAKLWVEFSLLLDMFVVPIGLFVLLGGAWIINWHD